MLDPPFYFSTYWEILGVLLSTVFFMIHSVLCRPFSDSRKTSSCSELVLSSHLGHQTFILKAAE